MSKTIFEKIWDSHVVDEVDGWTILYIDRHLAHDLASARMSKLEEETELWVRRLRDEAFVEYML